LRLTAAETRIDLEELGASEKHAENTINASTHAIRIALFARPDVLLSMNRRGI